MLNFKMLWDMFVQTKATINLQLHLKRLREEVLRNMSQTLIQDPSHILQGSALDPLTHLEKELGLSEL